MVAASDGSTAVNATIALAAVMYLERWKFYVWRVYQEVQDMLAVRAPWARRVGKTQTMAVKNQLLELLCDAVLAGFRMEAFENDVRVPARQHRCLWILGSRHCKRR